MHTHKQAIYWELLAVRCQRGDAKAFRIYADAYRQDPKFFDFTRSMEAYKKSFDERSTVVMSPDSEFFHYLKQR